MEPGLFFDETGGGETGRHGGYSLSTGGSVGNGESKESSRLYLTVRGKREGFGVRGWVTKPDEPDETTDDASVVVDGYSLMSAGLPVVRSGLAIGRD